jgi:hypothetical protein
MNGVPLARTQAELTPLQTIFLQYGLAKAAEKMNKRYSSGAQKDTADQRQELRERKAARRREAD